MGNPHQEGTPHGRRARVGHFRLLKPRSPNCVFWALSAWWLLGGYILIRKSITPWRIVAGNRVLLEGSIPHFLWLSRDWKHCASYVPKARPKHLTLKSLPMVLWFDGRVSWGDRHSAKPITTQITSHHFLLLRVATLVFLIVAVIIGGVAFWAWRLLRLVWWLVTLG